MADLVYQSAQELIDHLGAGRISARELLDAHVQRHVAVHADINAVVAVDLDRARDEAQAVDDARARGEELGPLAGLPMTIKDGFDVDGLPAVSGHPAFADRPPNCADADVVAAARAAGAIVWGKTNVPLMLGDFQSYNAVYGTTNNPYDLARTPGGSSGGAAAALAAGVTPLEIGSDIGGSLRHPANFCGVHALKPTWNALPMRGHVPPPPGAYVEQDLGVAGPMARTARDLRLLYGTLRRDEPSGPRGVAGTRIALWLDEPNFALSSEARSAVEQAADALRRQGAIVEPAPLPVQTEPLLDTYFALMMPILSAGFPDKVYAGLEKSRTAAIAALAGGADRYSQEAFVMHATASYRTVAAATVARQAMKDALAGWFTDWDAILAPISPVPAFTHRHDGSLYQRLLEVAGRSVPYPHLFDWISLATTLHVPALAAPVTRTLTGLPIGAQLIGRWHEEDRLLDLADALEAETGGFAPPRL
ncbi:MAG: amidase family protein [Haloechinothrix sp.]